MKILNLFAGIGGNRELWGNDHEITAVELNKDIADVYADIYKNDAVVICDAVKFLENHYAHYDFIWASPPCPTHGQYRHNVGVLAKGYKPLVPEMTSLYGIIVFLKTYFKGLWAVENTKPYYAPLIEPTVCLQRHLFWSNFPILQKSFPSNKIRSKNKISDFKNGYLIANSSISNKRQVLRNCINPEIGLHVLNSALDNMGENHES